MINIARTNIVINLSKICKSTENKIKHKINLKTNPQILALNDAGIVLEKEVVQIFRDKRR